MEISSGHPAVRADMGGGMNTLRLKGTGEKMIMDDRRGKIRIGDLDAGQDWIFNVKTEQCRPPPCFRQVSGPSVCGER